ncbi:MAG: enoyl-CoA hydratase/isomerase family protein [Blastocatellales bacterium]|nr:enoyl-CoA hydratase/isomerase family protein [Blastocatellales bacterium]
MPATDRIATPPVLLSRSDRTAVVALNRPAQMNCLGARMLGELERVFSFLEEDNDLAVVIVTGMGGVFSAGADLNEVAALDAHRAIGFSRRGQALMSRLDHPARISIAAIDGYCLGGGLDLALGCDLRYATPRASFQHPGARRGIITGWGGTARLPRLVGDGAARWMFMTAERIDAREAYRYGLINEICEDAMARAERMAASIVSRWSPEQIAELKAEKKCRQFRV